MLRRLTPYLFLAFLLASGTLQAATSRPNFLILLADDMGFSDAACYGGEIATPNLDRLAKDGLRFTQAYNTARCWPTRAALLTGFYAQHVRRDNLPGLPESGGVRGTRPEWARLLPALLKAEGYKTYHSGKWHIDQTPASGGFDRSSYGLVGNACTKLSQIAHSHKRTPPLSAAAQEVLRLWRPQKLAGSNVMYARVFPPEGQSQAQAAGASSARDCA
jgi:arylsulfatase A-like enzyme